jgi:hypothetical protein
LEAGKQKSEIGIKRGSEDDHPAFNVFRVLIYDLFSFFQTRLFLSRTMLTGAIVTGWVAEAWIEGN